ncbi:YitT family protein [Ectobacillus ponti]|uniref:YitT family protein n=1 Tax=Ectobacillus ponti TaxID=2961894 RepID=A0AA42BPU7_9BACI|nr:YitT family protein [Ectobacillus ponti]
MKKWIAMLFACAIVSVGVLLLQAAGLVTGGTAGLSLSLSYLLSVPFAVVFFVINIPFYVLGFMQMGMKFTISTILAVSLLSVMNGVLHAFPHFSVHPLVGSVVGGAVIGGGLVTLFINGSSLGGANILALYLQRKLSFDPGKVNFVFDLCVVLSGFYTTGILKGLYSILSIFVISTIISFAKERIAKQNQAKPQQQKAA